MYYRQRKDIREREAAQHYREAAQHYREAAQQSSCSTQRMQQLSRVDTEHESIELIISHCLQL